MSLEDINEKVLRLAKGKNIGYYHHISAGCYVSVMKGYDDVEFSKFCLAQPEKELKQQLACIILHL